MALIRLRSKSNSLRYIHHIRPGAVLTVDTEKLENVFM